MADPNYIKRIQAIREKNILTRTKGKPLIFSENILIDLMLANRIPTCMQHCILKVFKKMMGSEPERFVSAANICGAVFQKHGYMKPGTTVLTGKGMRNNTRHRLEVDAGRKSSEYKIMVARLWKGYLDRRARELKTKVESVAPPSTNMLPQPSKGPTKTILPASPSTNVVKSTITIGPTMSTVKKKLPTEE